VSPSLPVRIIIIADDPLVRAGLTASLDDGEDIEVVAQFPLSELDEGSLDSVEADVFLIDEGWGEEIRQLENLPLPEGKVMIRLVDPSLLENHLGIPAHSLISRERPSEALRSVIFAAQEGWIILDPITSKDPAHIGQHYDVLTDRESEVLELIAEGLTNRAISTQLEISENTVKYHVNAIFAKLGAQSRTEAVVLAARAGLLPL
jgi:DNA-binding NarL/FixJ family response regulator